MSTADQRDAKRHPLQPIADDGTGVVRFKENKLIKMLLDIGPFDLNDIARWDVSADDRSQFAQLIGYSVSGWGGLDYVDSVDVQICDSIAENPDADPKQVAVDSMTEFVRGIKEKGREFVSELYSIHPENLDG